MILTDIMLNEYINSRILEAYEFIPNDSEMALKIFDDVLEIEPENIEAINGKGSTLMKLNKINDAEKYFDRSLSICENSSALINKGIISKNHHDYSNALTYYDRAAQNNPSLTKITDLLKNEICDIIDKRDIILSSYSKRAVEYIKMGHEYKNQKQLWDAIYSYEQAILEDSTCKPSLVAAIDEIKNILHTEFLFKTPEFNRHDKIDILKTQSLRALLNENDPEKALRLMNIILEVNEHDQDILNYKGSILFLFDKYNSAIECFDKCLAVDDEYYYAKFNKGLVLRRMNKLKESLDCFNEVLEITDNSNVKKYKSEILERLKK